MKTYIDISHHHPVTNWAMLKKNCPFLISKATQGTTFVDPTLSSFIRNCERNKIPYWLYTYLNKGNELAQAKFLVNTCKNKVGNYFRGYILDVEADNDAINVKSALDYLNGLGGKTMVYTMYADYRKYKNIISTRGSNCAWWEARYGKNDGTYNSNYPCHSGVDLHQYTDQGSAAGVSGKIDRNRLTGTKSESWFTGAAATAAVKESTYIVGKVYTTKTKLYIRSSAAKGTSNIKKKFTVTADAKKNCCIGAKARLKKGVRVTCKAVKTISDGSVFIQIPSGWILAWNAKTKHKNLS